ncbi:glycosyltransferase family 4 protein [Candidatus Chloroploca asiatica]|uniref:Glycosyl transferase family 1 n=1 Tax=Candidatus Chloroploca asiatica TaxID=1506545 RepID=A0A2H3L2U7_9CHLR|nr:glycosyltransferase family 4 protein [Candidatus Chloroploca asiatica]PDV99087.1 hypothetical protein A9Q02_13470 [Candidatus Chloroploca asiatica]
MALRIAHVTATFPPYRGGTGNVCLHNARELARRGHQVTVLTAAAANAAAYEERDGFVVRRLRPLVRIGNAPLLPGLFAALRGFDIVHLHYPFFGGEMAALSALATRTPLVVTYQHDVLLNGSLGVLAYVLNHSFGRLTLRSAARVLFSSDDYGRASHIRPLLHGREAYIGALPNGVDVKMFQPGDGGELREHLGLTPDEKMILLVAGLDRAHYFKGVEVLLTALASLPPNVRAVIVGDGDLRPVYETSAADLGLAERVHFAGRVSDAELPGYYRAADLAVLPSTTMGEAFGLVLVEALACGTPVIASDLPGVRTVVTHGDDGLLVPPGDATTLAKALDALLCDTKRRQAMGVQGRAKVIANYAWPMIGTRLEQIYAEVLGGYRSIVKNTAGDRS